MSRTGVTYREVVKAIQKVQGHGEMPTVERIRQVLGTGSNSTLAKYLKAYKEEHHLSDDSALPSEITQLMSGLWERTQEKAEQRVIEAQEEAKAKIKVMEIQLNQTQKECQAAHAQNREYEKTLEETKAIHKELREKISEQHLQGSVLSQQKALLDQQLNQEKAEKDKLHRLLHNVQKNLEHYQSSIQQLQQEQSLLLEKERAKYETQVLQLRQHLESGTQEKTLLKFKVEQITQEVESLKKTQEEEQSKVRSLEQKLYDKEIKERRLEEKVKELLAKSKIDTHEVEVKAKALVEAEKKLAMTETKIEGLEHNLRQTEDKNQALHQERLFITQENTELKMQLKQILSSHYKEMAIGTENAN